jgi:hypothetical protein
LRELSGVEVVLVTVPKPTTTRIRRMMTDAVFAKVTIHMRIGNLFFKQLDVERRVRFVDARHTLLGLDLETHGYSL